MAKKKMLMVSLEDEDSKDIAQVITNKSCRKILDYLSQHEKATEGKIAKDLDLPLSTTNYSIKQLMNAELINGNEYNYSEKGKKVFHYELANQFIIIAPKKAKKSDIKKQLKEMLGLFGVSIIGAFGVFTLSKFFGNIKFGSIINSRNLIDTDIPREIIEAGMMADQAVVAEAAPMAAKMVVENVAEPMMAEAVVETTKSVVTNTGAVQETFGAVRECIVNEVPRNLPAENAAIWFLTGAIFIIVVYLLYLILKNKSKNKKNKK